jgi:hypothetical protein
MTLHHQTRSPSARLGAIRELMAHGLICLLADVAGKGHQAEDVPG